MSRTMQGVIHGRTVELSEDPGLLDGEEVKLTVEPIVRSGSDSQTVSTAPSFDWGEGLRRCAGGLADSWTNEDDRILEQIYQERQHDTRPEMPQ